MRRKVRAFGVVVDVETDDERLFPLLDRRLPSFPEAPRVTAPQVSYRAAGAGGGHIVLLRGRRTLVTTTDLRNVSDRLVADLQSALGRLASGWTFVHAGVVTIDGRALLLPAHSWAGKTTLVAALLQAGASYGSDEFAVLDHDGLVHPYARQLARRTTDRRWPAPHVEGPIMPGRTTVGAVVFTAFGSTEARRLSLLSPGMTILRLLEHCPGARARPAETLAALRALARGTPAFAGPRGEADMFARRLIEWARNGWRTA